MAQANHPYGYFKNTPDNHFFNVKNKNYVKKIKNLHISSSYAKIWGKERERRAKVSNNNGQYLTPEPKYKIVAEIPKGLPDIH